MWGGEDTWLTIRAFVLHLISVVVSGSTQEGPSIFHNYTT